MTSSIQSKLSYRLKSRKLAPIVSGDEAQNSQGLHVREHDNQLSLSDKKANFVKESISFKAKYIYDGIISEFYSIIFAPLLMYFM